MVKGMVKDSFACIFYIYIYFPCIIYLYIYYIACFVFITLLVCIFHYLALLFCLVLFPLLFYIWHCLFLMLLSFGIVLVPMQDCVGLLDAAASGGFFLGFLSFFNWAFRRSFFFGWKSMILIVPWEPASKKKKDAPKIIEKGYDWVELWAFLVFIRILVCQRIIIIHSGPFVLWWHL